MRALALSLSAALASPLAQAAGTASTTQASYWMRLVELLTRAIFLSMALASLVLLVWLCARAWKTVNNATSLNPQQDPDVKPMTLPKMLGGLLVCVTLFLPHKTISLFGDLLGLSSANANMSVCFVTNVSVQHLGWTNNATACIENLKVQAQRFAQYTEQSHLESANLPLLFGVVQMMGLLFFGSSSWTLGQHFAGVRNMKISPKMAIIAMMASSAIIMLPNAVAYIEDIRGGNSMIISPP